MGNKLFTDYTIENEPYLYNNFWKIYLGTHNETKEKVSIFVFDKNDLLKYSKEQSEKILFYLRKEVKTLEKAKNQHKNFLNIIKPISEDSYKLAFISEKVSYNIKSWIKEKNKEIDEIEKKLIINQILNVTKFMHNTYHISHNNLNINNIFLTEDNTIKISGFYSITSLEKEKEKINQNICELTRNIKYFSPEMINEKIINFSSDIFSLGLIFYYILNDYNEELIDISDNYFSSYKNFFKNHNLNNTINSKVTKKENLNFILNFLQYSTNKRIKIEQSLNLNFFKDKNNKLQTFCYLNNLENIELKEAYEFLKELPNKLNLFSNEEIRKLILPNLCYSLQKENLINPIIPSIFAISDLNINFKEEIYPFLKQLFNLKILPSATLYIILKRMNFIIENISSNDFINDCIPIICKSLNCGIVKIQEVIIDQIKIIYKNLEYDLFIDKIYFRLIQILYYSKNEILIQKIFYQLKELPIIFSYEFINDKLLYDMDKILKNNKSYIICKELIELYQKIINTISQLNIRNIIIPNIFYIISEGEITEKLYNESIFLINDILKKLKDKRKKNFIVKEEKENKIQNNKIKNDFENLFIESSNSISKSTSDKSYSSSKLNDDLSSNSSDEFIKNEILTKLESENNENYEDIFNIKKDNKINVKASNKEDNDMIDKKIQNEIEFNEIIKEKREKKKIESPIKKNKYLFKEKESIKTFKEKKMEIRAQKIDLDSLLDD